MFLDKLLMYLRNAAFDDASEEVDLSVIDVGKGEPLKIFFSGGADFVAGSDDVTITFQTHATKGSAVASGATKVVAGPFTAAECIAGVAFFVPYPTDQYSAIVLAGTSLAGTGVNCGIVLDHQSSH